MHYLLIVEGEKAEPKLFESIFKRYGFTVIQHPRPKSFNDNFSFVFDQTSISNGKNTVHIMQAPNNCIEGFLKKAKEENWDLSKTFNHDTDFFAAKFIVFDVDHAPNDILYSMMSHYCDEADQGLLIVSSPCLEILSEPHRKDPITVKHLREYKSLRNTQLDTDPNIKMSAINYIVENFEDLILEFLISNVALYKDNNVMEHPHLAIDEINRLNYRSKEQVCYRYFTTVIYVVIACIMGLTKQVDNANVVLEFLKIHSHRVSTSNTYKLSSDNYS